MANAMSESTPELVYFVSDVDGKVSTVERDVISLSPIVMGFIEDVEDCSESPIPLAESTAVIEAVIRFCRLYKHDPFEHMLEGYISYQKPLSAVIPAEFTKYIDDIEKSGVQMKVFMCASFLNIDPLYKLMAARIANIIRPDLDKRPSEAKADLRRLGYWGTASD